MNSNLSQKSLVAKFMTPDPIGNDTFEERTAILEFDASMSREEAERQVLNQVISTYSQHHLQCRDN